jgi:predicted RNA binding protein YcfA (HicA-like mRNA interferase family)
VGFEVVRTRGSHRILRHPDGRSTSVPVHGARDVPIGTLNGILRQVKLNLDELQ